MSQKFALCVYPSDEWRYKSDVAHCLQSWVRRNKRNITIYHSCATWWFTFCFGFAVSLVSHIVWRRLSIMTLDIDNHYSGLVFLPIKCFPSASTSTMFLRIRHTILGGGGTVNRFLCYCFSVVDNGDDCDRLGILRDPTSIHIVIHSSYFASTGTPRAREWTTNVRDHTIRLISIRFFYFSLHF